MNSLEISSSPFRPPAVSHSDFAENIQRDLKCLIEFCRSSSPRNVTAYVEAVLGRIEQLAAGYPPENTSRALKELLEHALAFCREELGTLQLTLDACLSYFARSEPANRPTVLEAFEDEAVAALGAALEEGDDIVRPKGFLPTPPAGDDEFGVRVYQQFVSGTRHVRLNAFGTHVFG